MKEILSKISPSPKERALFQDTIKSFIKTLTTKLIDAKPILGGSGAKDTWLANNTDIDIFVQFDYKKYASQSEKLSDFLEQALRKAFPKIKLSRLHGSRDYFQLIYKKFHFEIVPILKITKSEQSLNITDISPLHSEWVNAHAKKIKDDIRLAKQFCRTNKIYGAESYINGFSGYILEILTAHYGSFEKLLQTSLKWKDKEVIDPSKFFPKKDALFNINKSKQQSPIIIIDPVDKYRNAAAALSKEKLLQFQQLARKYLKFPSIQFFTPKELTLKDLQAQAQQQSASLLILKVKSNKGKEDVVGVQLLKSFEYLKLKLTSYQILNADWEWDRKESAQFHFIVKTNTLPASTIRSGPPLTMSESVNNFKSTNPQTFVKDGKLYATIVTEYPLLLDFAKHLTQELYFKERVKSVIEIKTY